MSSVGLWPAPYTMSRWLCSGKIHTMAQGRLMAFASVWRWVWPLLPVCGTCTKSWAPMWRVSLYPPTATLWDGPDKVSCYLTLVWLWDTSRLIHTPGRWLTMIILLYAPLILDLALLCYWFSTRKACFVTCILSYCRVGRSWLMLLSTGWMIRGRTLSSCCGAPMLRRKDRSLTRRSIVFSSLSILPPSLHIVGSWDVSISLKLMIISRVWRRNLLIGKTYRLQSMY